MTTILFKWKNYCFRAKVRVNRCPVTSEPKTAEELGRVHASEALFKWLLQQQPKSRSERSVQKSLLYFPYLSGFRWF